MKLITIFLISFLFYNQNINGQTIAKRIDLIIVIDDRIQIGSLSHFEIDDQSSKDNEVIHVVYLPGNLGVNDNDIHRIFNDSGDSIFLKFNYSEFNNQN